MTTLREITTTFTRMVFTMIIMRRKSTVTLSKFQIKAVDDQWIQYQILMAAPTVVTSPSSLPKVCTVYVFPVSFSFACLNLRQCLSMFFPHPQFPNFKYFYTHFKMIY